MSQVPAAVREGHEKIDQMEEAMLAAGREGQVQARDLPLKHDFFPGIYRRQIFMPAGTLLTSRIHKVRHPYVVLSGSASVYIPGQGVEHIEAPHSGVTEPGTRRVLYIHEDCTWVTFHPNPTDTQDLSQIEEELIERREAVEGRTAFDLYRELLEEVPGRLEQHDYGGAP